MPDLTIHRTHELGLEQARQLAKAWVQTATEKLDMTCDYREGATSDQVSFKRSGVTGELTVTDRVFELQAKLGFLLGAFKDRIEQEIGKNLDELLARQDPVQAFRTGAQDFEAAQKA